MDYIVFDLEWNQSPYGKVDEEIEKAIPFEIIDIGAVKLGPDLVAEDEFDALVRPSVYKKMHRKIKEITHLKNSDLQKGKGFRRTFKDFLDWCGDDYMFCTWGTQDLIELQRNMKYYGYERILDFPLKFLDLQKLFSLDYEDGRVRRTLQFAVEYLNIEEDIPFHRALSDAKYTAKVMQVMHFEKVKSHYSIDTFYRPRIKEEEIFAKFDDYTKYISREFDSREEMLDDPDVISRKCDKCGRNLKMEIDWFSDSGKTYYCVGTCPNHGYVRGRIRVRKTEDEEFWCVKILKSTDEEGRQRIIDKQEAIREKRREKRQRAYEQIHESEIWDDEPDEEDNDPDDTEN